MAAQPPHGPQPQYSTDRRWWWDGQRWIPVPPSTPGAPVAAPVEQEPHTASATAVGEARMTPIQSSGAAVRRFERRLAAFRSVARFLLLANVVAWVSAIAFDAYTHPTASGAATPVFVLGGTFPVLVGLSLIRVVTGKISREATLGADPERVFALLVDPRAWVRSGGGWLARYRSIDAVEPALSGGTKGRVRLTALGLLGEARWEMLEYQPPRRVVTFAWGKLIGIPTISLASWWLEPTDDGTHVRFEQECRNLGLGLGSELSRRTARWAADRMLVRLKAEAEGLPR
jgi:uncharacterized protein YndB with AHSA1/START domain